jgi:septal ring factor EnvC (AmiA/AmiB activator)
MLPVINHISRLLYASVLTLVCVWIVLPHAAQAQGIKEVEQVRSDRESTEEELKTLETQLSEYESQLSAAQQAEQSASERLSELDREIRMREQLVSTYTQRNQQLEAEVEEVTGQINAVSADYDAIRLDYQRRVIHAYKHGRGVYLALIMAAESLDRIVARVRYLKRFTDQRKGRVDQIRSSTGDLDVRRAELQLAIEENDALMQKGTSERARLASLRGDRSEMLQRTQRQRTDIEGEIAQTRQQAEQLQSRIQELIAAEAQRIKAMTESNPLAAAEFEEIAARFEARKGSLAWPVSGTVTEPFGTRVHPVYKTETLNPGIEISSEPSAVVKAVFDGQVTRIFFLPGYGTCVTVRHGAHTSMYANFSAVRVSNQQRVSVGQILGEAGTVAEPRGPALFFALFSEDGEAVDPAEWLRPQ